MIRPPLLSRVEAALGYTFKQVRDIHAYFHDPKVYPPSYREVMTWEQEMVRDGHGGTAFIDEEGRLLGLNCYACKLAPERIQELLTLKLPDLLALNLNETGITQFAFTERQPKLMYVNLSQNESLTEVRFESTPTQLRILDVYDSRVQELDLPAGLSELYKLDAARNQQLKRIHFAGGCKSLFFLDLSENALTELELPAGMISLVYVFLRKNQVKKLGFGGVTPKLETLDIRENQVREIPKSYVHQLPGLTHLFVDGNPIQNIDREAIVEGSTANAWEGIRNYLRSLIEDEAVENDEVKLILLGNSTAGKSSILRYLIAREYDPQTPSTHGIRNVIWQPDPNSKIRINVWDFGGQEFYHATHRLFLSNNAVNLVVFEAGTNVQGKSPTEISLYRDGELFTENMDLDHFPYTYWLNGIRYFAQGIPPICLVENKMDKKEGQPRIPVQDSERESFQLPPDQCFAISVQETANQNPDYEPDFTIFERQLRKLLEKTRTSSEISDKWLEIKAALRKEAKNKIYLSREAYVSFCERIREDISKVREGENSSALDTLTRYLHNIGIVLYYADSDTLKEYVFINPERVIDAIYQILDYNVQEKQEGAFTRTQVEARVRQMNEEAIKLGQPQLKAPILLELMTRFELIFVTKKDQDTFVAPQYLPEERPVGKDFTRSERRCTQHAFTLWFPDFLPRSVITRFICRQGHLADDTYWKQGILYEKGEGETASFVLVECHGDKRLTILVEKPEATLIGELFNTFLDITGNRTSLHISPDGTYFAPWLEIQDTLNMRNLRIRAKSLEGEEATIEVARFAQLLGAHPENSLRLSTSRPKKSDSMTDLQKLIAKGEIERVFELIESHLDRRDQTTLINLQSRWNRNETAYKEHRLDQRDYDIEYNRITAVLNELAEDISASFPIHKAKPKVATTLTPDRKIYFSYSWKDSDKEGTKTQQMIENLLTSLKQEQFPVVRDKEDLPYGGIISQFMKDLGTAPLIVVFTSERYFRSAYCMHELCEIGRNAKWEKELFSTRILPIFLERVDFDSPATLSSYIKHWQEKDREWELFFQENKSGAYPDQNALYERIININQNMGKLGAWVNDINASSLQLLSEDDFALIKTTITQRLASLDG